MRIIRLLVTILLSTLLVYTASAGDPVAGEARYKQSCINCHGMAGKGAASYPKISGKGSFLASAI